MFNYIDLINPIFDRMNVIYYRLHEQVNSLDRYQYDGKNFVNLSNPLSQIPNKQGGIYIIFEKGETYKDFDRIVRVGKAEKSLLTRLTQHFIKKDKDHSVFRKHIGRSLLRQQHCDLEIQDWDTKGVNNIEIEDKVTEYLIENISFCIIPLSDKGYLGRGLGKEKFKSTLDAGRYQYILQEGQYGNREQSFFIFNIGLNSAKRLSALFLQESFIWGEQTESEVKIYYYETSKLEYKKSGKIDYKLISSSKGINLLDTAGCSNSLFNSSLMFLSIISIF